MSLKNLTTLTAASLTARYVNRAQLAMTITRMDAGVEPPWTVDICSSAIAPALPY